MFRKLSNYFYSAATPKNIFIAVLVQLIFGFLILPKSIALIDTSGVNQILDLRFGYSATKAVDLLNSYGPLGRKYYFFTAAFIDNLYAGVYSVAFSLMLSMFFRISFSPNHYLRIFNIFPFLIGIADIVENLSIIKLLLEFPSLNILSVKIASYAGLFKWGCTLFNIILLFTGIIAWGVVSLLKYKRKI